MAVDLTKKRTFLVCGHAGSGKTSLCEAILYKCQAVARLGRVDDNSSISDWEDDEKERKSSINLSILRAEYKGNDLQFIDVPGYLDFVGELICAVRAVDFAIIVVDAVTGVSVGTEKAWEIIRKENLPCIFFINKLDKEGASFEKTLADIQISLTKSAVPVDFLKNNTVVGVLSDKACPYYSQLVERIAETDDVLLEKYLTTGEIDEKELPHILEKAVLAGKIFPVVAGEAVQCVGIEVLLDALIEDVPCVEEEYPKKIKRNDQDFEIKADSDGPLIVDVFKTIIDPFIGQLNIFRVLSGTLRSNQEIFNCSKKEKEKIGQLFLLQGKQQDSVDCLTVGDIGAVAKLKITGTQDILCDSGIIYELPLMEFPAPAYSASIKPHTRQDDDKISAALTKLSAVDPTIQISRDSQTHELILSGMGELHLQVIIGRMRKKYSVNVDLGTPKVPYFETISKPAQAQYKHKKQSGGHGQYGEVMIKLEPLSRGQKYEFEDAVIGGRIPRNYIPSVEKGVRKAMEEGILAGYPVTDIKVTVYDGSYHDVDSSDIAFQIAASTAFKDGVAKAGCVLLEPIMNVEISIPDEFMGSITGDINGRRGKIQGMDSKGKNQIVKAQIPLAEMFKYASDLRSVTGGRGSYAMNFSHYDIVPARTAQSVIDQAKKERA